jgi:hypothetical protein
MSVLATNNCYILPHRQGTDRCGEVKYFAKYPVTEMPVTLPLVPTGSTLSSGHSYKLSSELNAIIFRNSEVLSHYLSSYSVEPPRTPTPTTALPQCHNSPCPISSKAPLLPVVTSLLSYLLIQQRNSKLNFLFHFSVQIFVIQLYQYILQRVISEIQ